MSPDSKIKLSFIIPVYNAELYLNKCVDSILNSNSRDIEIILVDDGSSDRSSQICDKYAENNRIIKTIHQKNSGVASARNTGMKEASGDYIFFVDDDDWIDGSKVENLLKILNETNSDIIINRSLIATKNKYIRNDFISNKKINGKSAEEVINYFRVARTKIGAPWQYVFKKEIAIKNNLSFNTEQNGVDDSYFSAVLFINSKSFYINNDIIYFWNQRFDSQGKTHNSHNFMLKMISSIENMSAYINNVSEKYKINYLYFNIYKNIYALFGPYDTYSSEDKAYLNKWYKKNEKLINKSVIYAGLFHRILNAAFGNFGGTIISYKFAILKGKFYLLLNGNK